MGVSSFGMMIYISHKILTETHTKLSTSTYWDIALYSFLTSLCILIGRKLCK